MAAYFRNGNLLSFMILFFCSFTLAQVIDNNNRPETETKAVFNGNNGVNPDPVAGYDPRKNVAQGVPQQVRSQNVPLGGSGPDRFAPNAQANDIPLVQKPAGPPTVRIWDTAECGSEVQRLCSPRIQKNNFAVLDCLQNADEENVNEVCQHFLWQYKQNLTLDVRFDSAARQVCGQELDMFEECKNIPDGPGMKIPCLVEHMDEQGITPNCRQYLTRMATIVFSDYRLIYKFADACNSDIVKLNCGRLEDSERHPHSQGATLECLAKQLVTLTPQCKRQLLRVAELQSDDYHMDRPLYYACHEDRERFCEKIPAGSGKIYECLFKHKFDQEMSKNCREKLVERQQIIAEDVKVDKTFFIACKSDMDRFRCFFNHNDQDFRRSTALLCLENAMKKDQAVTPECIAEMSEMRRNLMSDYQISPEIVVRCQQAIKKCQGLHSEGRTLHCLMDLANKRKTKDPFSVECKAALEDLIREADPVSNLKIDRVLAEACEPVVNTLCKDIPSSDGGRIMNCLMENLDDPKIMTEDCEEKLMEIQYFVVRDFRLDPSLYKYCHKEAKELCHASDDWYDVKNPSADNSPMVLPCLYQHMKDKNQQVSRACKHEIRRTLRQRAKSVDLEPEIEENCMDELGRYCSNRPSTRIEKGEEIACLQRYFDKLKEDCQKAVGNFTEDEDEDVELDNILMRSCTPMLKKFCQSEMGRDTDASDVMGCLIEHKHDAEMDVKCAAGIEHHQLITIKDYRFSHKFKEACKESVIRHCKGVTDKSKVVSCLSEIVCNNILREEEHQIPSDCRKQLKVEVVRRGENIELDPELKAACNKDALQYCRDKHPGDAQVIECLKENQDKLSKECFRVIFKREKEEANLGDYTLFTVCKHMIKKYCEVTGRMDDILDCLKKQKYLPEFDAKCRMFVSRRQIQENKDYRLNPSLQNSCKMDIEKFCKSIVEGDKEDQSLEGQVIQCLKQKFVKKMLSKRCNDEIYEIIKDAAQDYRQDPILAKACTREIQMFCQLELQKLEADRDDAGQIEECLKEKLYEKKLNQSSRCFQEVLRLAVEVKIDVNIDPVLHATCQNDINRFCGDLQPGKGRQMTCLLSVQEDHPAKLSTKCLTMLQQRKTLWELSAKLAPPEALQEVYNQVISSPAHNYSIGYMLVFAVLFCVVIIYFLVGKRVIMKIKTYGEQEPKLIYS